MLSTSRCNAPLRGRTVSGQALLTDEHVMKKDFGFYSVLTNPVVGYERACRIMVEHGVPFVQLRMKDGTEEQVRRTAARMRKVTEGSQTKFIVNDYPDIAHEIGADGVHLGQSDMSYSEARQIVGDEATIGISTHNPDQTKEACRFSPDYIGVGPVYTTPTKAVPDPVIGLDGMAKMLAAATVPAVCIGGISLERLPAVLQAGARNVCIVRPVCQSEDPEPVVKEIMRIIAENR